MSGAQASPERSAHTLQCRDGLVCPAGNDAAVVAVSVVLGVIMRSTVGKMLDHPGLASMNPSGALNTANVHSQAWTMTACFLSAGVMSSKSDSKPSEQDPEIVAPQCSQGTLAAAPRGDASEAEAAAAPQWDPLDFSADRKASDDERLLEIKHGHLSMLAHVGLVTKKGLGASPKSSDLESNCSTGMVELCPECGGDSWATGSASDADAVQGSEAEDSARRLPSGQPQRAWPEAAQCMQFGEIGTEAVPERAFPAAQSTEAESAEGESRTPWSLPRGSLWSDFAEDDASWGVAASSALPASTPAPPPSPSPAPAREEVSLFSYPPGSIWSDFPEDTSAEGKPERGVPHTQLAEVPGAREEARRPSSSGEGECFSLFDSMPRGSTWSELTNEDFPQDFGAAPWAASGSNPGARRDQQQTPPPQRQQQQPQTPPRQQHQQTPPHQRQQQWPMQTMLRQHHQTARQLEQQHRRHSGGGGEHQQTARQLEQQQRRNSCGAAISTRQQKQSQSLHRPGPQDHELVERVNNGIAPVPNAASLPPWRQISAESQQSQRPGPPSAPAAGPSRPNTNNKKIRKNANDKDLKMPEILRALENTEQERIIMIRKMKKLGFHSASLLRTYFEACGAVECVYVSHSHLVGRMRPSSLGFVVMQSQAACTEALKAGTQQVVMGVPVFVSAFEQLDRRELSE